MKHYIILFAFLSLIGCKGDPGPAGSTLSGDISGSVILYSDNRYPLQNSADVLVSIDQGFSSTLTSSDGSWTLVGIPAGIHTLEFSKTGYFTRKTFNMQFVGGGTFFCGSTALAPIPPVSARQLILTGPDSNSYFHFQGTLSSTDSINNMVEIIFDKTPPSSSSTVTYLFSQVANIIPDSTSFFLSVQFNDIAKRGWGLSTGTQLYARAFVPMRVLYYENYNPFTGKYELYDREITFSNTVSLTVP